MHLLRRSPKDLKMNHHHFGSGPSSDDCDVIHFKLEAPYFQALYHAPVPVLIARDDGRFLLVNRAVEQATGLAADQLATIHDLAGHVQAEPSINNGDPFTDLFDPQKTMAPFRVTVQTKDGRRLIWELFNAPLGRSIDGQRMVISIASDITAKIEDQRHLRTMMNRLGQEVSQRTEDLNATIRALESEIAERKRIGDALTESRERLKQMSRRTLDVLEADRRTVSKELHDSIGASLAAIKFSLEEKEMKRERQGGRLDESLEQEIAYLIATIKESKRISANLRPTTLDDLGLMATIQWYLRQFQRMYANIRVDYTTTVDESDVPESMKIIIYRIVQEGLSNVGKHGEAKSVRLRIAFSDSQHSISLLIEDDGRGFDVEEVLSIKDPLSGYGLTAMRERCEIFGGSFTIESRIGDGTCINAVLPI
jgi:PAS domain S-box-containing protein